MQVVNVIGLYRRYPNYIRFLREAGRAGWDGTRELITPPWVIVYRVIGGRVEVLRVLHGRQKWP